MEPKSGSTNQRKTAVTVNERKSQYFDNDDNSRHSHTSISQRTWRNHHSTPKQQQKKVTGKQPYRMSQYASQHKSHPPQSQHRSRTPPKTSNNAFRRDKTSYSSSRYERPRSRSRSRTCNSSSRRVPQDKYHSRYRPHHHSRQYSRLPSPRGRNDCHSYYRSKSPDEFRREEQRKGKGGR